MKNDCFNIFLPADTPMFSRELVRPLRLASLAVGLALLIAGSIWLPSDDWDIPICFVMGLPAYVLATWTFRQVWYLRWRWVLPATLAFWVAVDGTYTLYWWLNGFPHLATFRPANFIYCTPLFWIAGCLWNLDFKSLSLRGQRSVDLGSLRIGWSRLALAGLVAAAIIVLTGVVVGFCPGECDPIRW